MFKNFPALLTGPLARRPERPLSRFIPRSLRAIDPRATGGRTTAIPLRGSPLTTTLTESGAHAACVGGGALRSCDVENVPGRQAAMPSHANTIVFRRQFERFLAERTFHGAFALSSGRAAQPCGETAQKADVAGGRGDISNRPVTAHGAKASDFETRKLATSPAVDIFGFSRLTGADEDRMLARQPRATKAPDRSQ